jgi:hypothetical protein
MDSGRNNSVSRFSRASSVSRSTSQLTPRRPSDYARVGGTPVRPVASQPIQPVEGPTFGTNAIFVNRSLHSLSSISLPPNIKLLNVERNQIQDFIGFTPTASLETLKISDNPIASLRGMPILPKLVTIEISQTPFAKQQFYRVALLILFGKSLRLIDGERISGTERQIAGSYPAGTDALVRAGWTVTYPPPSPQELGKIKADLSSKLAAERAVGSRTTATIVRKPARQSKLLDERLSMQNDEMKRLAQEIQSIQQSKNRLK